MASINPYLTFDGKTEAAFNFYKSVFGGDFATFQRFKDTGEVANLSEEEGERIMHVALPIGKNNVLMGSDTADSMGHTFIEGTNFSLSVSAESKEEANRIFENLSIGGTVQMPMADTFWGSYFGMLHDKFGIQWMVSYDKPVNN